MIEIKKGIPMPNGRGKHAEMQEALARMEIGDCISVPAQDKGLHTRLYKHRPKRFMSQTKDGITTLWRKS